MTTDDQIRPHMFPVHEDKRPATSRGFKDATEVFPEGAVNIAIACEASGCAVIDVDCHPGQEDGYQTLNRLERLLGPLESMLEVETPSGGKHLYFRAKDEKSGRVDVSVDIKAKGGYVVAPPTPGYKVTKGDTDSDGVPILTELTELPEAWRLYLERRGRKEKDVEWAVKAFIRDNRIQLRGLERCPMCNHRGCFKLQPSSQTRWVCFSTNHTSGGMEADDHWWGDVLDIHAYQQGKSRYQLLVEAGYLDTKSQKKSDGNEVLGGLVIGDEAEIMRRIHIDTPDIHSSGGDFWQYDPGAGFWSPVSEAAMQSRVLEFSGMRYGATGVVQMSSNKVSGILRMLKVEKDIPNADEVPGIVIGDRFVTVHLGEIKVTPHKKEHYARSGLQEEYDPDAKCPKFLKNMAEVFKNDHDGPQKLEVIRQFIGICLLGKATTYNRAMVFIGEGNNGKSVVIETISGLFPEAALHSLDLHALSKPEDRAQLVGKKLNVVSDIRGNDLMCGDDVKAVFSGEYVSARQLYGKKFQFRPTAGHLFGANKLPASNDNSKGFWRRWIPISFNMSFDGTDRTKEQVVKENLNERQGIIRWALEGAITVIENSGYTMPPSMQDVLEGWQTDSDKVRAFVRDCCMTTDPGEEKPTAVNILYKEFEKYCKQTRQGILSAPNFRKRLKAMGLTEHKQGRKTAFALSVLLEGQWRDVPEES